MERRVMRVAEKEKSQKGEILVSSISRCSAYYSFSLIHSFPLFPGCMFAYDRCMYLTVTTRCKGIEKMHHYYNTTLNVSPGAEVEKKEKEEKC